MRIALAARDIPTVYKRLKRLGFSHRRLAGLTGQSSSEVTDILNGRQVMAYDLLVRIAEGLNIPRGHMGLAYDASIVPVEPTSLDEREDTRRDLARAAEVAVGAGVFDPLSWVRPVDCELTSPPARIGVAEIEQVEIITGNLGNLDRQYGGGACRDAVLAHLAWAQRLLSADADEAARHRLHVALADLHGLAGWTSFDVGLYRSARRQYARALEQARFSGDPARVAKILYCTGRLHLHQEHPQDALRFFQLGQIAAQESGCGLAVAMLCVNEAWAYATLGASHTQLALKSLGRAQDEFARADPDTVPGCLRFFGRADLSASTGVVQSVLSSSVPEYGEVAVASLLSSLSDRGDDMARSRTFELTALATVHLREGDVGLGVQAGHEAVGNAERVRSRRVLDRLAPLRAEAQRKRRDGDVADLADRIALLCAM